MLSGSLLAESFPQRRLHVQAAAREAARICAIEGVDAGDLHLAAVLHDNGYASTIAHARFHLIDGAASSPTPLT